MHLIKKTCMHLLLRKRGIQDDRRRLCVILYFIHEYCMYKRRNKTLINVQRKLIANSSWRPLKVYDNETAENEIEQRRRTEIK